MIEIESEEDNVSEEKNIISSGIIERASDNSENVTINSVLQYEDTKIMSKIVLEKFRANIDIATEECIWGNSEKIETSANDEFDSIFLLSKLKLNEKYKIHIMNLAEKQSGFAAYVQILGNYFGGCGDTDKQAICDAAKEALKYLKRVPLNVLMKLTSNGICQLEKINIPDAKHFLEACFEKYDQVFRVSKDCMKISRNDASKESLNNLICCTAKKLCYAECNGKFEKGLL